MTERDPTRESGTDDRYDEWPVQSEGAYADWTIERKTPREEEDAEKKLAEPYEEEGDPEIEWIGIADPSSPVFYSPNEGTVYQGDLDHENQRIDLSESDQYGKKSGSSIADQIAEIGDEHGWKWLSSFARDHLEDQDEGPEAAVELRGTEFHRENVLESNPYDLQFFGSVTFLDDAGREHVVERWFEVYPGVSDGVTVEVNEKYLFDEQTESDTDAEIIDEAERELEFDIDTESPEWNGEIRGRIQKWHEEHAGWLRDG